MSNPRPKTKLDEVSEIIYNNPDNLYLSEFQVARYEKMINDAQSVDFIRAKRHKALIYYQGGYYDKSRAEIQSLTSYVDNGVLFNYLIGIAIRIGAINEAIKVAELFDIKIYKTTPESLINSTLESVVTLGLLNNNYMKAYERLYDLSNDIEKAGFIDHAERIRSRILNLSRAFEYRNEAELNLPGLLSIIAKCIDDNKIRTYALNMSAQDDGFLMDLLIISPIEKSVEFNDKLFDLAYENSLIKELNLFSANFAPVEMEQLKNAIR